MRVDFVGHATLLVRCGGLSLLSDPWWTGPAYRDQWYPWPIPVPERYDLSGLDAVYISHSHEDHLHAPTLRALLETAPDVLALIPLRADTQMRDYLRRIGFRNIREVGSGSTITLCNGPDRMRVTLYTHVDDSLIGIEAGDEVLLNLNDALHSSRRALIVEYCRVLRKRFPKIDYLFCGFGGASYFPNCVHVPGKDDVAVARARERFFLQNFLQIAQLLSPRFAFPFAAHFVLPDERNWWISQTRLQLEAPSETVRALAPNAPIAFHDLQPGDYVSDGQVHSTDPTTGKSPETVRAEVRQRYGPVPVRPSIDAQSFHALIADIRQRVAARGMRPGMDVVVVLTDYAPQAIRLRSGTVEPIDASDLGQIEPQLRVETRSDLVRSAMRSPFGKDLISIGYAGQFYVRSRADLGDAPHDAFLELLSPLQPRWRQRLRDHPLRASRYVLGDPSMRHAFRQRLLRRADRDSAEPAPYEMRDWVAVPE